MPGTDGVALMRAALERDAELPVILVTGHGDVDLAVQSMREGAYDFIEKALCARPPVETVRRALDKRRLTLENRALRAAVAARTPGRPDRGAPAGPERRRCAPCACSCAPSPRPRPMS
jgi:two-component system C4-dicarboxylate transport response regulator DctD